MKLPEAFLDNMRKLLGDELDEFVKSLESGERYSGIRANTLRISPDKLPEIAGNDIGFGGRIPWCDTGFYYEEGQPGRNPLYHAGVYYIQEPSAMYPAANVPLKENGKVLDICAAPGGKSTQLAARMAGKGFLVANDISEERTKALVKNIQMAGVRNAMVTNETPENLAAKFENYFDTIVVDAPCSGEGMFRKDEEAVKHWDSYGSARCRAMQDGILEAADRMLKQGGVISYSTCTFEIEENEGAIDAFMDRHPEYFLIEAPKPGGIAPGIRPNGTTKRDYSLCARLWPHKLKGEGHFTAFLKKGDDPEETVEEENGESRPKKEKKKKKERFRSFRRYESRPLEIDDYYDTYMTGEVPEGCYFYMGDNLYYLPSDPPDIDGLKVAMAGVYEGEIRTGEFKMSHRLALTLKPKDFAYRVELEAGCPEVDRYLKGETVVVDGEGVSVIVFGKQVRKEALAEERVSEPCCVAVKAGGRSFVLGLGAISSGTVKNLYPKGWRRFT
ncbi:MAG: RsmF rRNA methyltransferase first C-terminal domain-containing protein [Clostridia bacterium]|nr:RsmF rRNA methyltransferase first C-terminal domain-containing protein [Clostridia bacterium]